MTEDEFFTGKDIHGRRIGGGEMPKSKTPLQSLDEVVLTATTPGNAHADHYMRGMANGLILAHHIMHDKDDEIVYIEADAVAPEFDYMAEADKTCSIVFNSQNVDRDSFVSVLNDIAKSCDILNIAKKLLFRGKTPEQLGLPTPTLAHSLAVEFDPNNCSSFDIDLLHGLVGVITEAGEMAEVLLHRIKTGEFDRVNAIEEVGDVSWYLARQLRGMNADFDMSNKMNIEKLHGRHGAAFDVFRDANRDLTAERVKLEAAAPLFDGAGEPPNGDDASRAIDPPAAPAAPYGPCEGDDIHHAPEPDMFWSGGCWRRQIVRDVPGLAV